MSIGHIVYLIVSVFLARNLSLKMTSSSSSSIPLDRVFADTPAKKNLIHLNNAGASLMPTSVLNSQVDYLNDEASIGGYETVIKHKHKLDHVYQSVANLLNPQVVSPDEIALFESATVGFSQTFYSIPFQSGDKILCIEQEYVSNYLVYLHLQKEKGIDIMIIPTISNGEICLQSLAKILQETDNIKVVSICHIPTNSGLVVDIESVGNIIRSSRYGENIIYVIDACQSAGQLCLDIEKIQCDILTATSRKYLRGPRGAGFAYVKNSSMKKYNMHPPIIDLRGARWKNKDSYELDETAKRFEWWEFNYAAQLGMGVAIDYAMDIGIENIERRIKKLSNYLRRRLAETSEAIVLHSVGNVQCGIVSFDIMGMEGADVVRTLREKYNINVSLSGPTSTLLDSRRRDTNLNLIRASVHYYNDEDEIEKFISAIDEIQNFSDPVH